MRIEVTYKEADLDGRASRLAARLRQNLDLPIERLELADVYFVQGVSSLSGEIAADIFSDPVVQQVTIDDPEALASRFPGAFLFVEVTGRPGVTDPVAITARTAIEAALSTDLGPDVVIQSARLYLFAIPEIGNETKESIGAALHNPLIQRISMLTDQDFAAGRRLARSYPHEVKESSPEVAVVTLSGLSDSELEELSRKRLLALSLQEMRAVKAYYRRAVVASERRACGLPAEPTDVELEMIAQTWSEHCKHKIFNATIRYREGGRTETIDSLFRTYIKSTTDEIAPAKGYLRSVFHDNSGVIAFDEENLVCFKVETHNSPSALDPYGGAITGIVGVNRDILGTGKGARPIFNTDVLCFGYPDTPKSDVGDGLLHPSRVLSGVHEGIIDGGNQSGIPVVAGAFLFDDSFLGKPLVFCGTGGILPTKIRGEEAWIKHIDAGDLAVMVGGRIGKDGIHGATFSSLALDEASPTSAVQIGDPITQKKMSDFLLEARDLGLYKGITDNGAGGLSSSLGEMAQESGGIRIELDSCPLKYPGLAPWEILVSESQERMSLAVEPRTIDDLLALARRRGVEATVVGAFTSTGMIEVTHGGRTVGSLSLEFLHAGLPTMRLEAEWPDGPPRRPARRGADAALASSPGELLLRLLAEPNIASKESLVRQYDHEVQGQSVVKPFVGEQADGPSDGAVLRPLPGSTRGLTVTHGICPAYSAVDTYDMAMCAVDEAYRSHIALGGNPVLVSALDNFCWPDPVQSKQTPDGRFKLAQLVRACRGLREACIAYSIPLISGKDSMKNDAQFAGRKVSILPTLLVSLMGVIDDVRSAVTSDFKRQGDLIYLLGETRGELGAGACERLLGVSGDDAPRVRPAEAMAVYDAFHRAASLRLIASAHDLSEGGLGVALAESAYGGRLGAAIAIDALIGTGSTADGSTGAALEPLDPLRALFCETPSRLLVSVRPADQRRFETLFGERACVRLGEVSEEPKVRARSGGRELLALSLDEIGAAWKGVRW